MHKGEEKMNAKTYTVSANTVPSTGFIAGHKVMGYVPADQYRLDSKNGNRVCIVPITQWPIPVYEGTYYWINKRYLEKN